MLIDNRLKNFIWLSLDKILKIGLGIFLIGITARYFGVELFGILSVSFAYATIFTHIASLGLGNIVVKEFVKGDINESHLISASILCRAIAGLILYGLLLIIILNFQEKYFKYSFLLINSVILFKWVDVVREYYESKVLYKFVVIAEALGLIISALLKLGLIFLDMPFSVFVWIYLIENIIISCLVVRLMKSKIFSCKDSADIYKLIPKILSQSWPLMVVALTDMILLRVDILVLGFFDGFKDIGEYSAAVRIATIITILPYMIVQTLIPSIINAKKISQKEFLKKIRIISQWLILVAYLIIMIIYWLGGWIISLVFGDGFSISKDILIFYSLTFPPMFLGVIGHQWYVANDMQKVMMIRSIAGSIFAVIFAYFSIKIYGISGALWSVIVSYGIVFVFVDAIFSETKSLFWIKIKAIFLWDLKLIFSKNSENCAQ